MKQANQRVWATAAGACVADGAATARTLVASNQQIVTDEYVARFTNTATFFGAYVIPDPPTNIAVAGGGG